MSTSPFTEETRENYDPQKTAVRSEQTSNETRKAGDGVEGIPGALSNQPPGTSGAPVIAGATPTPGSPGQAAAPGAGDSRQFGADLERTAQHAQFRGRSHARSTSSSRWAS